MLYMFAALMATVAGVVEDYTGAKLNGYWSTNYKNEIVDYLYISLSPSEGIPLWEDGPFTPEDWETMTSCFKEAYFFYNDQFDGVIIVNVDRREPDRN